MIDVVQPAETVATEKIDRIRGLPLAEVERPVDFIRAMGARLAVPRIVDMSNLAVEADEAARIVLESEQQLPLKLDLQMARDEHEIGCERPREGV
jgi:hypothetical protein